MPEALPEAPAPTETKDPKPEPILRFFEPILRFFKYDHLPPALREISAPFGELAVTIATFLPRNAERSVALRKLLEAKDAAVRAALPE